MVNYKTYGKTMVNSYTTIIKHGKYYGKTW